MGKKSDLDIVYEAWYIECIHEAGAICISLHKTRKGAEIAKEIHKEQKRKEHEELLEGENKEGRVLLGNFDDMSRWGVRERIVYE